MKAVTTIAVAIILALVLGAVVFAGEKDRLKTEHAAIATEWEHVESGLRKRANILPALSDALSTAMPDQAPVFGELANARAALDTAPSTLDKIDAHNRINAAIGKILVVLETRPELKSGDAYRKVQLSLESSETEVLRARSRYNAAIKKYNTDLALFPANLVSQVAGFEREDAYFLTEPARTTPAGSPNRIASNPKP